MKTEGAMFNTHECTVYGMQARGSKKAGPTKFVKLPIRVMFTSDEKGETISLQGNGIMLTAPFEVIEKIIKEARDAREA